MTGPGRSPAARLRTRLADDTVLIAPGAYDALLATLIQDAGFDAVYLTGSGVSYSSLAAPDIGLVTGTEMVAKVWEVAGAVDVPVIADGDTGYGDTPNVARTVRDYERAGAAAIQLEDQDFPKRCGHYRDKALVPAEVMVDRLRTATDARADEAFVIIARTDARAVHGLAEALDRASRYAEAGADMIFVEAPQSVDELAQVARDVPAPTMANMVEGGLTPSLSAQALQELGFSLVIYPNALTRALVHTARELLRNLRTTGTTDGYRHRMVDFPTLTTIVGGADLVAPTGGGHA